MVEQIGEGQLKEVQKQFVDSGSKAEQVGLKNLGCTCYINSVLQQLFNISSFRERLLAQEISPGPEDTLFTKSDYSKHYQNYKLTYQLVLRAM